MPRKNAWDANRNTCLYMLRLALSLGPSPLLLRQRCFGGRAGEGRRMDRPQGLAVRSSASLLLLACPPKCLPDLFDFFGSPMVGAGRARHSVRAAYWSWPKSKCLDNKTLEVFWCLGGGIWIFLHASFVTSVCSCSNALESNSTGRRTADRTGKNPFPINVYRALYGWTGKMGKGVSVVKAWGRRSGLIRPLASLAHFDLVTPSVPDQPSPGKFPDSVFAS